ncbi:hypothetical protein Lser_V15G19168 [Lactuca serriola]
MLQPHRKRISPIWRNSRCISNLGGDIAIIEALSYVPAPANALRLYLQSVEAANNCDLERVAYEFFTQAFVLYEEEIALIDDHHLKHGGRWSWDCFLRYPPCRNYKIFVRFLHKVNIFDTLLNHKNCRLPSALQYLSQN